MMVAVGSHSCRKLPATKGEKWPTIMQTTMVGIYTVWSVQTLAVGFIILIKPGHWAKALKKLWTLN